MIHSLFFLFLDRIVEALYEILDCSYCKRKVTLFEVWIEPH